MFTIDSDNYIEITKSGFDYPSEAMNVDDTIDTETYNTVTEWLDDFGWV